jgi:hypothetical protein
LAMPHRVSPFCANFYPIKTRFRQNAPFRLQLLLRISANPSD